MTLEIRIDEITYSLEENTFRSKNSVYDTGIKVEENHIQAGFRNGPPQE